MLKRLWVLLFLIFLLPVQADAKQGLMLQHHNSVQRRLGLSNYLRKEPIGIVLMDNGFGSESDIKEEFPDIAGDIKNRVRIPALLNQFTNANIRHGLDAALVLRSEINSYGGPNEGEGLQFYFSNGTAYDNAESIRETTRWIEEINHGDKGPNKLIKIVATTVNIEWGSNNDLRGIIAKAWSEMVERTGVIIIASAGNYGWRVWDGNIIVNPRKPKRITFDGADCLKIRNHPQNAVAEFVINWDKNPEKFDTGTDFDIDAELFEIKGIRRTKIGESKRRQKSNIERNKDGVVINMTPNESALAYEVIDSPFVKESKPKEAAPAAAPVGIQPTPVAGPPAPPAAGAGAVPAPGQIVIPKPDRNRAAADGSVVPVEAPKADRPAKLKLDEETDYELCLNIVKGDFSPDDNVRITVLNPGQETPSFDPVTKKVTWPTEIIAPAERLKKARSIFNPSTSVIYVGANVPYSGSDPKLKLPQIMMPSWTASVTLNDRKTLSGVTESTLLFVAIVARMFDYRPTLNMDFLLSWNALRPNSFGIDEIDVADFKKDFPNVWNKIVASLGRGKVPTNVGIYRDSGRYAVGVNLPPENLSDPNDRNRPLFENLPTKDLFGPDYQFFLSEKGNGSEETLPFVIAMGLFAREM